MMRQTRFFRPPQFFIFSGKHLAFTACVLTSLLTLAFFWLRKPFFTQSLNKFDSASAPILVDRGDLTHLKKAIRLQLEYFQNPKKHDYTPSHPDFTRARQIKTYRMLLDHLNLPNATSHSLAQFIKKHYDVYQLSGDGYGKVLATGYYVPLLKGSRQPSKTTPYPLYRPPKMERIDLKQYRSTLPNASLRAVWHNQQLIPMHTRHDIDFNHALAGQKLEILYLANYMDQFFLHIQGSGLVELENGKRVAVGYLDQNGRSYHPIGKNLLRDKKIRKENMSMQAIKTYFVEHPQDIAHYASLNESYVFFRELPADRFPLGSLDIPLTPWRSIASDHAAIPSGALTFVHTEVPVADTHGHTHQQRVATFMLNQDTGGAIKGTDRIDMYFGNGPHAEYSAGHMAQSAKVYAILARD